MRRRAAGEADVLIVNTCGFLHASTGQSVGVLRDLDAGASGPANC